jgi:hypothetical protein
MGIPKDSGLTECAIVKMSGQEPIAESFNRMRLLLCRMHSRPARRPFMRRFE